MAIEEIKISPKENGGKGIERMYTYLQETKQNVARGELRLHCSCLHQRGRSPSLKKTGRNDANGNPIFICKRCGKEVNLQKLDSAALLSAVKTVDQALDIIKILANPENEKDDKLLRRLIKTQFRLAELPKQYDNAIKKTNDSGNKNKNKSQSSSTTWGKASVGR